MLNTLSLYLRYVKTADSQLSENLDAMLEPIGRYNPFDYMFRDNADRMADEIVNCFLFGTAGLCVYARDFFLSAVLYVYALNTRSGDRTLGHVRGFFLDQRVWHGDAFDRAKFKEIVLDEILGLEASNDRVSGRTLARMKDSANRFLLLAEENMEGVVRLIVDRTRILDDPAVAEATAAARLL